MSDVFFRAEHLKMQFYAGNKRKQMVLDDASFTVEQGEAVGIVGPSGAGKSTIARIICGLIRPEYGDIYFKGTHIVGKNISKRISYANSADSPAAISVA